MGWKRILLEMLTILQILNSIQNGVYARSMSTLNLLLLLRPPTSLPTCNSRKNNILRETNENLLDDPSERKRHIVFVDDEESMRTAVGRLLMSRGYQVTVYADSRMALNDLKNLQSTAQNKLSCMPDLIVSDIRMPEGMGGLEFLHSIRSNPQLVDIPVVLLTAKGMPQDRIEGYNTGADAYITKPFDPEEFLAIISNLISLTEKQNTIIGNISFQELKRDLEEIKSLLYEQGGSGPGNGWVEATNVFLTPGERNVLKLLCEGYMNKEIASRVGLSRRRIEQILTGLFRKTKTNNRTELVRWAISTGNVQI